MSHWRKTEYRRLRPFLGTFVEVRVQGLAEAAAISAINQAFEEIATVERSMSAHDRRSDLGRIFDCEGIIAVHPWTFEVIEAAQRLHRLSRGVFDVTVGAILEHQGSLPVWSHTAAARGNGTMADIELLDKPYLRSHQPVRLDLGGIAKGFAVDRAIAALIEAGAEAGCVNAGGDFRMFGHHPEPLLIRHPEDPSQILRTGEIRSGAVATSAGYFYSRERCSAPLIDGRTRSSKNLTDSITVIAPSCMWADALTKVLAVNPEQGEPLLNRFNATALLLSYSKSTLEFRFLPSRTQGLNFPS